uniref:Uncharacterized protein n=1 Tax=Oryza meridionalis TaxID=40149 RepID=A0A0E0D8E3_9ORYZ
MVGLQNHVAKIWNDIAPPAIYPRFLPQPALSGPLILSFIFNHTFHSATISSCRKILCRPSTRGHQLQTDLPEASPYFAQLLATYHGSPSKFSGVSLSQHSQVQTPQLDDVLHQKFLQMTKNNNVTGY